MAGPQVTATITAVDQATAVIDKLVGHAREAGGLLGKAHGDMVAQAANAQRAISERMSATTAEMSGRLRTFGAEASGAMGLFAASGIRAALHVGDEMERVQRRMAAFTDTTAEQMRKLRAEADTTYSGLKGGPEGFFEGARAAAMSGVRPEQAGIVSRYGAVFADETGEGNAEATEKLVQHTQMLGHLRDDTGKMISFSQATAEQTEKAMRETMNLLISVNKIAPGNIANVFEGFKFMGPTMMGLGRDANEAAALYTVLAEHGIVGEEAGNTVKSSVARLLSPTARARQSIAAADMDYGSYIKADPTIVTSEGIEKGVALRLGTLDGKVKTGIESAVERFKASSSIDDFNRDLTDVFVKSGVKTVADRLKASNLARDVIANFASTADLPAFLRDAKAKGLGVGFLDSVFGQQQGGRLAAVDGAEIIDKKRQYDEATKADSVGKAMTERAESYGGSKDAFFGAWRGMLDSLFQPVSGTLATTMRGAAEDMKAVSSMPEGLRGYIAEMTAAFAAVKTSSALSSIVSFGSEIAKLAPGAEGAAAGLGRVAGWLGILGRFSPAGEVITALQGAQLAYEEYPVVAEAMRQLGKTVRGDYYTPADNKEFHDLSQQRDEAARQLAAHDARTFDPVAHDPQIQALRHQLGEALAQQPSANDTPEVSRLRGEYNATRAADPNAADPVLKGLLGKFDELTGREKQIEAAGALPPGEMVTEFRDLRRAIEDRQSFNIQDQASRLEGLQGRILDALSRQPAEANEPAPVQAIRHDIAERERDVRAGYVAPVDPVRNQMVDAVQDLDNRLASFDRKISGSITVNTELLDGVTKAGKVPLDFRTFAPPTKTFDVGSYLDAVDPRPNMGLNPATRFDRVTMPTLPEKALPVAPAAMPNVPSTLRVEAVDLHYRGLQAPMTIGDGPNFGLHGPMIEPTRIEPVTARSEQPIKLDPVKVDTNVSVQGTVSGQAEVHQTIAVEVQPSPYFAAMLKRAEHMSKIALAGELGTTMGTTGGSGVKVPTWHGPH